MGYETPDNLVELLDHVVRAAGRTPFYSQLLKGPDRIRSLEDFGRIPVTPLERYREQRLADVLADPGRIEWIVGPYKGQSTASVAVAEGPEEGAYRCDLFTDAVKECESLEAHRNCAVVTSAEKRYFAAEIATILIRSGVPSHLFVDNGGPRTYERLHHTSPDLLVILSEPLAETELPRSIERCVTFRRSQRMEKLQQLDLYVIDELGFLGHSTDCEIYTLNRDVYYFERSDCANLVVTSLFNRVQPMLRLQTMDKVRPLEGHTLQFAELSASV